MRFNSPTCKKRSGKTRSVTTLIPSRGKQGHELGLKVGRITRERLGGSFRSDSSGGWRRRDGPVLPLAFHADFFEPVGDGDQVIEI